MKKSIRVTLAASSLITSPFLLANQAGDFLVRAGVTLVEPDSDKANVALNGDTSGGLQVSVDEHTQLGFNFVYFYTNNIAFEVLAATPFTHDIKLHAGDSETTLGETSHLPPTVSVLYYFDSTSNFKPYVGAGINYTVFFDESFSSEYSEAGFSDLELDDSIGYALQVGADYHLNDKWHLNTSARYISLSTDANFKVGEDVKGSASVDVNPMVYSVMLGYKF